MFANTEVNELFVTPLWTLQLKPEVYEPLNAHLGREIRALSEKRQDVGLGTSLQTDPILHQRPEFAELMSIVNTGVKSAIDFMEVEHVGFEITGCWANICPNGAINSSHNHPNNFLSGVYYVDIPKGSGEIEFSDPRPQMGAIMPRVKKRTRFNANKISLAPKPGQLVIFPAWLVHAVGPNQALEDRISISFNAMFKSFTENMSPPLWRKGSIPVD
jgi:uncharacterized protein (TIGR02466 family)